MSTGATWNIPWVFVLRVNDDDAARKVIHRIEQAARDHFEVETSERDRERRDLLRVQATTTVNAERFHGAVIAALAVAFRIGREWSVGGGLLLEEGEASSSGGIYEHLYGIAARSFTVAGVEWASFEVERTDADT